MQMRTFLGGVLFFGFAGAPAVSVMTASVLCAAVGKIFILFPGFWKEEATCGLMLSESLPHSWKSFGL